MTDDEMILELEAMYNVLRVVCEKTINKTMRPNNVASTVLQIYYNIMMCWPGMHIKKLNFVTTEALTAIHEELSKE